MNDFFQNLLLSGNVVSSIVVIALASTLGVLLGKIQVRGVRLGSSGALFAGLLLAHFGLLPNHEMLHLVKEFGLILFVYALGIEIGPRFMNTFRNNGFKLNLLAVSVVVLGFCIAALVRYYGGLDEATAVGLMSGAVTNTPGLGAAQQALTDLGITNGSSQAGMAYALAYPFGVIGLILAIVVLKALFRVDLQKQSESYLAKFSIGNRKIESIRVEVTNENVFGKKLEFISRKMEGEMVISRIERNGDMLVASDKMDIQPGDILYGAAPETHFADIELKIGRITIQDRKSIQGNLAMFHVLFTNRKLAGKTVEQIGIYRRYEANITRIFRSGIEILPTHDTVIEMGDLLRIVGKRELLTEIRNELGNSVKELTYPNTLPLFLGIVLGVIVGSIPVYIPGLPVPARLGLAGGPLLIAIFFGHKGRIGKLNTYMSPGANSFIREFGILLFLASVGLGSGAGFADALFRGGLKLMGLGILITAIPVLLVGLTALLFRFNFLELIGVLSGSMTDPPALEFASNLYPSNAQSASYATVYPLTMILRIVLAQVMVFV